MTPAERVVVEAAVRWYQAVANDDDSQGQALVQAVEALLAERAGPQSETVEITWAQVVEGDEIYRAKSGGPIEPDNAAGKWFTVTDRGGLIPGTDRIRLHAKGIGRPIQPIADKLVTVKRGVTGRAVDALGAVLWSGINIPTDAGIRHNPAPVPDVANDPEASEES